VRGKGLSTISVFSSTLSRFVAEATRITPFQTLSAQVELKMDELCEALLIGELAFMRAFAKKPIGVKNLVSSGLLGLAERKYVGKKPGGEGGGGGKGGGGGGGKSGGGSSAGGPGGAGGGGKGEGSSNSETGMAGAGIGSDGWALGYEAPLASATVGLCKLKPSSKAHGFSALN